MSRSRKRKADNRPVEKPPEPKDIEGERKRVRRTRLIIAGVVIAVITIIVVVSLYISTAPYRITVLKVDDTTIRMDYFLKRIRIAGSNAMAMLDMLTREQIFKLEAPNYGIEISDEDIEQGLRLRASGGTGEITDSEFKEWYRQQLNETNLSDSEYREITRTSLIAALLQEYQAERLPTTADQVHFHAIVLPTYEEAVEIRARWENGEDFIDLFKEIAGDEASKEEAWDIGWFPAGVNDLIDYIAFDRELNIGDVSQPISSEEGYFYLFMAIESENREIDENDMSVLKSKALDEWYFEIVEFHDVSFHGLNNGFDSYTNAWINLQILKK